MLEMLRLDDVQPLWEQAGCVADSAGLADLRADVLRLVDQHEPVEWRFANEFAGIRRFLQNPDGLSARDAGTLVQGQLAIIACVLRWRDYVRAGAEMR